MKANIVTALGPEEFRKAMYSSQGEWSLACIEAQCEVVATVYAKLHPKAKWHPDTAHKALKTDGRIIFVFQLKGHRWTILLRTAGWLGMEDLKELPDDAKKLSAELKTRALTYMAEDTSGCEGYELFERGKSIEEANHMGEVDFKSSWRKEPDFGDKFPEPVFSELGIYLPECWMDNDGFETKLILGGIPSHAVERLDCFEFVG